MPLAGAEMKTGPSFVTVSGSLPLNAGYLFGTTRTSQPSPSPLEVSSAGGVASSAPGQNGHGRDGSASTWATRGAKSLGRSARPATTVIHRPVSGFRRSLLMILTSQV